MALSLASATAVPACRTSSRAAARGISCARSQRCVARATEKPSTTEQPTPTTTTTATDFDGDKMMKDLKEQWDAIEDKTSVAVYGAGALTLLWLSSTLVSAINNVPLVPKLMELVGLAYTAWFVYRYLLFKESRKELINDVEELKKKISGDSDMSVLIIR